MFSIYIVMLTLNLLVITLIEAEIGSLLNKFRLPERISGSNTTAGDEVLKFAEQYDYVDMAFDFLDDVVPISFRAALANATLSNDPLNNQFTPSHDGDSRLLSAIAKFYSPLIRQNLSPDKNIVITVGMTEAFISSILGHTSSGDEWVVIQPSDVTYITMIKACDGIPRITNLKKPKYYRNGTLRGNDWVLDEEELANLINKKTKGIVLINPVNPLGKIYTLGELQFIADLARRENLLVISEEGHEWINYRPFIRIASLPDMLERTITIGTVTKTFSLSGWRIGWAYGGKDIMSNVKAAHKIVVQWTATPEQVATASIIEEEIHNFGSPASYIISNREQQRKNRDLMVQAFLDAGMWLTIPDASSCMFVDWSPLKSRLPNIHGATDFAKWFVANVGVLGLPGVSYYSGELQSIGEDYLRFCFNKKYDNLKKAAQRLRNSIELANNKSL